MINYTTFNAEIAQLGERQTEDLKVPGSIPGFGTRNFFSLKYKLQRFNLSSKTTFLPLNYLLRLLPKLNLVPSI